MKILVSNSILLVAITLALTTNAILAHGQANIDRNKNQRDLYTGGQQITRNGLSFRSLENGPNSKQAQDGQSAYLATTAGEGLFKKGDVANAIAAFQIALTYDPNDIIAFRGLSKCYAKLGDTSKAIAAERRAVYFNDPAEQVIRDNDTSNLVLFASLLDKAGQATEATIVYNHAATLLKYMDDKPSDGYLMPLFGAEPGQIAYTSNRLQALTQVGLGIDSLDTQEAKCSDKIAHLKEAIRLYPESPIAYAYLTYQLNISGDAAGAKVAEARSYSLGLLKVSGLLDAQTAQMQAEKAQK